MSSEDFEKIVKEELDSLPEEVISKTNNVAFLIEDYPTPDQEKKFRLGRGYFLFGLYEGYHQSSRRNLGAVLPDRITLFKYAILHESKNEKELRMMISNTIKHEIAHHFGSDEAGARKASR